MSNISAGNLWRHSDFLKLWVGTTVSLLGNPFTGLALQFIAATILNATPNEMGILAAARTAPSLVIGLFVGVWVDRNRRRSLMIVADIGRALILVTIPAAAILGMMSMYQLYVAAFAVGALTVFFDVSYQAFLPSLVSRTQLAEGNSKLEMGRSTAQVAGPSLAGFAIQLITAPMAIVFDVLTFLASAVLLYSIGRQEQIPEPPQVSTLVQVREGLAFTFRNHQLRAVICCTAMAGFCDSAFFALYVLFGTRELGLDAGSLGLIFGIGSIAALFGALLAGSAAIRVGFGKAIVLASLLGGLEFLPAAFATPALAVPLLVFSGLMGNFGWTIYNFNNISLRQSITPVALQGRMNATMRFVVLGMALIGSIAGGMLAQFLGLREAIVIAAVVEVPCFLWVLFSPVRGLTRFPEEAISASGN